MLPAYFPVMLIADKLLHRCHGVDTTNYRDILLFWVKMSFSWAWRWNSNDEKSSMLLSWIYRVIKSPITWKVGWNGFPYFKKNLLSLKCWFFWLQSDLISSFPLSRFFFFSTIELITPLSHAHIALFFIVSFLSVRLA